jgi:adenylosuccinate lyase
MAIHPIDYRYGTPEMKAVWGEENRFRCIVAAEVALAQAEAACGVIPADAAETIARCAGDATLARANEIEAEINHDMMAVVKAVTEVCGDAGRWIHFGATSNDILDTATGLQMKAAMDLIEAKLRALLAILLRRAGETTHLVCVAGHGQHGVPRPTGCGLRSGRAKSAGISSASARCAPASRSGNSPAPSGRRPPWGRKGLRSSPR